MRYKILGADPFINENLPNIPLVNQHPTLKINLSDIYNDSESKGELPQELNLEFKLSLNAIETINVNAISGLQIWQPEHQLIQSIAFTADSLKLMELEENFGYKVFLNAPSIPFEVGNVTQIADGSNHFFPIGGTFENNTYQQLWGNFGIARDVSPVTISYQTLCRRGIDPHQRQHGNIIFHHIGDEIFSLEESIANGFIKLDLMKDGEQIHYNSQGYEQLDNNKISVKFAR